MVTACPECYRAFSHDYPENGIETGFKVTHIFELAETQIGKGAIGFSKLNRKITFQDPCRLSRTQSGCQLPRNLLQRLNVALSAKCATGELLPCAAETAPGPDVTAIRRPCR